MSADRAVILGVPVARWRMAETVSRCAELIEAGVPATHVSANAAKLVKAQSDTEIRRAFDVATIVSADGQAVVWASRVLRDPVPERVAGIDLMRELMLVAAERGYPIYVLGARPDVLEEAVVRLRREHPSLVIAGYRDGYFAEHERTGVAAAIRGSGAKIVFVAMGSPLRERWLVEQAPSMSALTIGVGGAIDVLAGRTRRAPVWMQRVGLEWLFRAFQEPLRLGPRYATTNLCFVVLVARAAAARRLRAHT